MVGELVGETLDIRVDLVVYRSDFERLLIDLVWRASASAPTVWYRARLAASAERTDDSLCVFGSTCAEAEFSQLGLGLVREGVKACLGGLPRRVSGGLIFVAGTREQ